MRQRARLASLGLLLPLLAASPAGSQYLYLDTNGNGIRDADDRMAEQGPTTVDVWLVTDRNRDGTPVVCENGPAYGMTINSYSFVLHAVGGTVKWGPMQNRLPFSTSHPAQFGDYADTTNTNWYHNGWGWSDKFPAGSHHLATLTIEPLSGDPVIFVEPSSAMNSVHITQFGTECPARDSDHTYTLGLQWQDADGLGGIAASAGGPYQGKQGRPVSLNGGWTRAPTGETLTYLWSFGDGSSGSGIVVNHVYAAAGDYQATLTVSSASWTSTDVANVHIVPPLAPIAKSGGAYSGNAGYEVRFNGTGSYDPDGLAITSYSWDFGDGSQATGAIVRHVYASEGTFTARLTVSNGILSDSDDAVVTVRAAPNPPVAAAGGPYQGIAGRTISFFGGNSSDADGDPLEYRWLFGDGGWGIGVTTGHAYSSGGTFQVTLTVSDGILADTDETTATIVPNVAARAFVEGGRATISLADTAPINVHIEPDQGSFEIDDVDAWPISLHSTGTGVVGQIPTLEGAVAVGDTDGNEVSEVAVTFEAEDLLLLFGGIDRPTHVEAIVRGNLIQGGSFVATLDLFVRPVPGPAAAAPLRIAPNPFNPVATVTFSLARPGPVRAELFDVQGRKVRTVIDGVSMEAGPHLFTLDARSSSGSGLASGIYFFRLAGPDGTSVRRVAVAK